MKMKYIKVTSDKGFGAVKHIVLQVEETDTFITSNGIDAGFKIIIDCTKHRISASGGHTFNPYYNESARIRSCKLSTNESDVLGFYLSQIDDINNLPDEIDGGKFWEVIYSTFDRFTRNSIGTLYERIEDMYNDGIMETDKKYFKILYTDKIQHDTFKNLLDDTRNMISETSYLADKELIELIKGALESTEKQSQRMGFLNAKITPIVYFSIAEAETYKQVDVYSSSNSESTIADYLWCEFDELPPEDWNYFYKANDLNFKEPYQLIK